MNLNERLNTISPQQWQYYHDFFYGIDDFQDAMRSPLNFVQQYFWAGGKNDFLCNTIFNNPLDD